MLVVGWVALCVTVGVYLLAVIAPALRGPPERDRKPPPE